MKLDKLFIFFENKAAMFMLGSNSYMLICSSNIVTEFPGL